MRSDRVAQQDGGLVRSEPQIGGAQFGQLAAHPQPRQRQGRVGAAGHHHVQAGRRMLDQERQRLVDHRVLDHVVVVQHQEQLVGLCGQLVDDLGDETFERSRGGRAEQGGDARGEAWTDPIQRGGDVAPESHRIVVTLVQGEPPHSGRPRLAPVGQHRRLAEAGGGADERQGSRQSAVELLAESGAGDESRYRAR